MRAVSSQWAMMRAGLSRNRRRSVSSRSTSMLPVLLPMKSFTPGLRVVSRRFTSSRLSLVAPRKKAWFTCISLRPSACLSPSRAFVTVCGTTLGMSSTLVTPPAAAAMLSVCIVALRVSPGSRKCTWSSMTPGMSSMPSASTLTAPSAWISRPGAMSAMRSSSMSSEPLKLCSSFTMVAFSMTVFMGQAGWGGGPFFYLRGRNFMKRRRITPKKASPKMPPDILLVPSSRLTNTTGTSFTLKPSLSAVYFISIWKA